jgi:Tfp pilus assembly protein PilF
MAAVAASRETDVRFGATPWSIVVAAGATTEPRAQSALTELCRIYWRPIYAYLRRSGYDTHDAQDLTQSFFQDLLKNETLGRVSRDKGRFRSFLIGALKLCLADEQAQGAASDLFRIQSDIAQAIIARLKVLLSPAEKAEIERIPTADPEAYNLYLRARALYYGNEAFVKIGQEDLGKAATLLESAIARDPRFTQAYCLLGKVQVGLYVSEYYNKERLPRARQAIDEALRISPHSAEAHLALAIYLYEVRRDAGAALKELQIAAPGLPGDTDLYPLRAAIEEQRGEWSRALEDRKKALEIDPASRYLGDGLVQLNIGLRRYQQAEAVCDRMIASIAGADTSTFWRAKSAIAVAKGDTKTAMAALDANPYRHTGSMGTAIEVAKLFMIKREYMKAAEILQSLEEVARQKNMLPRRLPDFNNAYWSMLLGHMARVQGDTARARSYFESARPGFEHWLEQNPEELSPWEVRARVYLAQIDAALGQKEEALRKGRRAAELWPVTRDATVAPEIATMLAVAYILAGEHGAALRELENVVKLPYGPTHGELKLNPIWDDLRGDLRFDKIIADAAKPIRLD